MLWEPIYIEVEMGVADPYPWVSLVGEYPDVFPKELQGLLFDREIEFYIDLVPRV